MHCISTYPTEAANCNLRVIPNMIDAFGTVVGFSDHTLGTAVAVAAVALGASIIEKHITLKRSDGGPDAAFSLEPDELARMVADCRTAWEALGNVTYDLAGSEKSIATFRRSLYAVADIAEGEVITEQNVRSIRPGYGLLPKFLPELVGKKASRAIPRGTPLTWGDVRIDRDTPG